MKQVFFPVYHHGDRHPHPECSGRTWVSILFRLFLRRIHPRIVLAGFTCSAQTCRRRCEGFTRRSDCWTCFWPRPPASCSLVTNAGPLLLSSCHLRRCRLVLITPQQTCASSAFQRLVLPTGPSVLDSAPRGFRASHFLAVTTKPKEICLSLN